VVARRLVHASRRMVPRGLLAVAFAAVASASARRARADVDLRWAAPASCPQREEVLARIGALAGSALEQTAGLSVEGTIAAARGRYWLTLLVRDGRETRKRVIASESCADLAGAAAITVALLLGVDAGSIGRAAGEQVATPDDDAPASARRGDGADPRAATSEKPAPMAGELGPSQDSTAPAELPASLRPWDVVVRAPIAAADVGPLPRPAFGFGLGAGVRHASWRILLLGRLSRPQSVSDADASGEFGARLERMTGELATCRGWRSLRFEIAPCVGVAFEHLSARGFGDGVSAATERATWPAASAGGVAHWYPMESLVFFLGMTGYVELSRPRLVIQGLGQIAQLAPVALGVTFGVEWIL